MVFDRARRIGRVFAVVLLAWTAADVLHYGACAEHRQPLPSCAPLSVTDAAHGHAHPPPAGPLRGHAGDCFCCCPYVDVRAPFQVMITYALVWELAPEDVARPVFGASALYHPPLA